MGNYCLPVFVLVCVVLACAQGAGRYNTLEMTVRRTVQTMQQRIQCTQAGLTSLECMQCLSPSSILKLLPGDKNRIVSSPSDAEELGLIILYHLVNFRNVCKSSLTCETYQDCRKSMQNLLLQSTKNGSVLMQFEDMLRLVKTIYASKQRVQCFTAEEVLHRLNNNGYSPDDERFVEKLCSTVLQELLDGNCIDVGDAVTDFIEDLFKRYGDNSTETITERGLERLLQDLRATSESNDEHHHHHGNSSHGEHTHAEGEDHFENSIDHDHHHEGHSHDHQEHDHSGTNSYERHPVFKNRIDSSKQPQEDNLQPLPGTELSRNGHDHSDHDHQNETGYIEFDDHDHYDHHSHHQLEHNHHDHDHSVHVHEHGNEDHVHDEDDHDNDTVVSAANNSTPDVVYRIQFENVHTDIPFSNLTRSRRSVNTPEPHLHEHEEDDHKHDSMADKCWTTSDLMEKFGQSVKGTITREEFFQLCPALIQQAVSKVCDQSVKTNVKPSLTELYGYGTLAIFVISLCSLVGVLLLPFLARYAYYYIMMGFIGLSFGAMAGDALLHLIPQVLGLHSHDEEDHQHSHDEESLVPPYLWRQLGLIGAIYGLFVFEAISELFSKDNEEDSHGSHGGHGHSHVPTNIPTELKMKSLKNKTESRAELARCSSTTLAGETTYSHSSQGPVLKSNTVCCGMSTLAMVIVIGGGIHNFADGLAVGAAFSSGLKGGISTSIAVFCHELPHEFGDFVVLISTGLGYKKALLLNFLSALASFVGLYIGVQIGENVTGRNWILTLTAGIFLYVALVDMLPELKQYRGKSPIKMFIVKNIGVLTGIALMMLIAIYEDKLGL